MMMMSTLLSAFARGEVLEVGRVRIGSDTEKECSMHAKIVSYILSQIYTFYGLLLGAICQLHTLGYFRIKQSGCRVHWDDPKLR